MILSPQLHSLLLCKMHPMLQQFHLFHENISLVNDSSWFEKWILTFTIPVFAYANTHKRHLSNSFYILNNNSLLHFYMLLNVCLPQNTIYFIILSPYFPIFLTFVKNHVPKFKYQTSQIKDNGLFRWVRGRGVIQIYFILCSTVCACLHLL